MEIDPFAVFIGVLAVIAAVAIYFGIQESKAKRAVAAKIKQKAYGPCERLLSQDGLHGVAFPSRREEIIIVSYGVVSAVPKTAIVDAELLEDSVVSTKASLGSTIGRAAVGGALVGPVGAIAGAATATRVQKEKIKQATLRIVSSQSGFQSVDHIDFLSGGPIGAANAQRALRRLNNIVSQYQRQASG